MLAIVAPLRRLGPAGGLRSRSCARPASLVAAVIAWRRTADEPVSRLRLGLAARAGRDARHHRRAGRRGLDGHADAGRAGRAARPGLFARIPERRAGAGARPLLHLPVAVRVLDDGAGARAEPAAAVHLLGAGRPVLVPADRLLVSEAGGGARGGQGVLDHEGRRRRAADRHRAAVAAGRDVRSRRDARAGRERRTAGRRAVAHHVLHLPRRRGQVGAVPAARLAARRDGGPDAGLRADSRGDDGDGGRVPAASGPSGCSR